MIYTRAYSHKWFFDNERALHVTKHSIRTERGESPWTLKDSYVVFTRFFFKFLNVLRHHNNLQTTICPWFDHHTGNHKIERKCRFFHIKKKKKLFNFIYNTTRNNVIKRRVRFIWKSVFFSIYFCQIYNFPNNSFFNTIFYIYVLK